MMSRWIDLAGAVNARDLGGLPTLDGRATRFGRVFRSDNLQNLTSTDVKRLVDTFRVRDVIDLRTQIEVSGEGPGPLAGVADVRIHHLSLYSDTGSAREGVAVPWRDPNHPSIYDATELHYLRYLHQPDNLITALRTLAFGEGATVVHCAAGKDRTSIVCAIALSIAEVEPDAIITDFLQTGEKIDAIIARLMPNPLYAPDFEARPVDQHRPQAEAMQAFLASLATDFGGALGWLTQNGWTDADNAALRARLLA